MGTKAQPSAAVGDDTSPTENPVESVYRALRCFTPSRSSFGSRRTFSLPYFSEGLSERASEAHVQPFAREPSILAHEDRQHLEVLFRAACLGALERAHYFPCSSL